MFLTLVLYFAVVFQFVYFQRKLKLLSTQSKKPEPKPARVERASRDMFSIIYGNR